MLPAEAFTVVRKSFDARKVCDIGKFICFFSFLTYELF